MSVNALVRVIKTPWSLIGLAWLASLSAGFAYLAAYDNRPGISGRSPSAWPAASRLERQEGKPTLLMFLHTYCPCSPSSVGELARLMTHAKDRLSAHLLFVELDGDALDPASTSIWEDAKRIPGVNVHLDRGARETKRFGATTSGHVYLFDVDGRRVFTGGITPSRGHHGDSLGRKIILEFLETGHVTVDASPVFGCSLLGESAVVEPSEAHP